MTLTNAARVLVVKNFEQFQHYKDRRPPWIKLYNDLLEDYAFLSLPDAARSHLMLLWLLASRHANRIPFDPKYIAQAIQSKSRIDYDVLTASGLISIVDAADVAKRLQVASTVLAERKQDASNALAVRKQSASPRVRPRAHGEAERETETETEPLESPSTNGKQPHNPEPSDDGFEAAWLAYPKRAGSNSKRDAEKAYRARMVEGIEPARILAGVEKYAVFNRAIGKVGTEFVMQAARFFGPSRHFDDDYTPPPPEMSDGDADAIAAFHALNAKIEEDRIWLEARAAR